VNYSNSLAKKQRIKTSIASKQKNNENKFTNNNSRHSFAVSGEGILDITGQGMTTTATTSLQNLVNVFDAVPPGYTVPETASQGLGFMSGATSTWELTILAFFVMAVMVYVFTIGRDRVAGLFLSAYAAWIGAQYIPFIGTISGWLRQSSYVPFAVFIVLFVIIFLLMFRSTFMQSFGALTRWWQNMTFAILFSGLFIAAALTFLPSAFTQQLSSYDRIVFASDIGRFCWIVLPMVVLAFFGSRRRFRI